MLESRFPNFYRFFNADSCTNELKFPPHIQISLPETVTLQDMYGNTWPVWARKIGGSWFFLDGWENFVQDNLLEKYDLLRFQYTREGLFDIKLYGLNGCDKKGVGYKKLGERAPNLVADIGQQPRRNKRLHWLGDDIFDEGLAPRPEGIYFVTKFSAGRMSEWIIPKDLDTDINIELPSKLKLIDEAGRTFTTKYAQWSDGRSLYKGGWSKLLKLNCISAGQICIGVFDNRTHPKSVRVSFLPVNRT